MMKENFSSAEIRLVKDKFVESGTFKAAQKWSS
jgi:hypothetical protein